MKITSASKKVLASALSAAMVIAFAPTVALGAETASLTEDQAKALGYTVKSVQVVNGASGSEVKTYYYKDLQEAFDSGVVYCATPGETDHTAHVGSKADSVNAVQLGLTLMADQDGEFKTNDGVAADKSNTSAKINGEADTISIETAGYKITNSKDDTKAPLTVSNGDTVTITGTGTIEQVQADSAAGAPATVNAIAGTGKVVLKGVTVTTASKKKAAVDVATVELEGANIAGEVKGVTKIKGGTYGAIVANAADTLDVSGTVAASSIADGDAWTTAPDLTVNIAAGTDLSVEASNTKNGKNVTGVDGNVAFAGLTTGKTASVKVSAVNAGSTKAAEMVEVETDEDWTAQTTYYKVNAAGNYEVENLSASKTALTAALADHKVYTFTAAQSATATGITGAVTGVAEGVTLEVTAKANGYDADKAMGNVYQTGGTTKVSATVNPDPVTDATAIGKVSGEVKKGSLSASAVSIDGIATGIALADYTATGTVNKLKVSGGTVVVSAEGYDATDAKSIAVGTDLIASAGKYTGHYGDGSAFTGGSYSVKPGAANYNATDYVVVDDGEFFTVEQAKNFTIGTTAAYNKLIAAGTDTDKAIKDTCVENILQDLSAGKAVSNITLAEGVKDADILAKAVDGELKVNYTETAYNAKRATDAQKAAYEAMKAYAAENLSLIETAEATTVVFYELSVGYLNKSGDYVKMADITDLGTKVDGRDTVANSIQLRAGNHAQGEIISYSGTVAKMPYAVKDGKTQDYVKTAAIPFATAYMTTDEAALKDAVIKGEEPSTPAPEKATQGIDVAKKSLTVKLGAKKTKTAKAKSFAMGASAETELTTAWKSGSTKITVSGDKVKLAKGAKRGTYTAKVSLKAAASDAYLAAAKTITVKFVIK